MNGKIFQSLKAEDGNAILCFFSDLESNFSFLIQNSLFFKTQRKIFLYMHVHICVYYVTMVHKKVERKAQNKKIKTCQAVGIYLHLLPQKEVFIES